MYSKISKKKREKKEVLENLNISFFLLHDICNYVRVLVVLTI